MREGAFRLPDEAVRQRSACARWSAAFDLTRLERENRLPSRRSRAATHLADAMVAGERALKEPSISCGVAPAGATVLIRGESGTKSGVSSRGSCTTGATAPAAVRRRATGGRSRGRSRASLRSREGRLHRGASRRGGRFERAAGRHRSSQTIGEVSLAKSVLRVLQKREVPARRRQWWRGRSTCASSPRQTACCATRCRFGTSTTRSSAGT